MNKRKTRSQLKMETKLERDLDLPSPQKVAHARKLADDAATLQEQTSAISVSDFFNKEHAAKLVHVLTTSKEVATLLGALVELRATFMPPGCWNEETRFARLELFGLGLTDAIMNVLCIGKNDVEVVEVVSRLLWTYAGFSPSASFASPAVAVECCSKGAVDILLDIGKPLKDPVGNATYGVLGALQALVWEETASFFKPTQVDACVRLATESVRHKRGHVYVVRAAIALIKRLYDKCPDQRQMVRQTMHANRGVKVLALVYYKYESDIYLLNATKELLRNLMDD